MNWNNKNTENLIMAISILKNPSEIKGFLRDLLTEREIIEFGNRLKAAQMLNNKIPYTEIEKETRLSSTTIARVSKWLNSGMGGYKLVLKRINSHHRNSFLVGKELC